VTPNNCYKMDLTSSAYVAKWHS